MGIKDRLIRARHHLGKTEGQDITREDLAHRCGWPEGESRVLDYENGICEIGVRDLHLVARITGVRFEWLAIGAGRMEYSVEDGRWLVEVRQGRIAMTRFNRNGAAIESWPYEPIDGGMVRMLMAIVGRMPTPKDVCVDVEGIEGIKPVTEYRVWPKKDQGASSSK